MAPIKRPIRKRNKTYLREWRGYAVPHMSQAAVARQLGRDHSTLQKLEAGKSPYNQDWLEELAMLYRCNPWDLISRDPRATRAIRSDVKSTESSLVCDARCREAL